MMTDTRSSPNRVVISHGNLKRAILKAERVAVNTLIQNGVNGSLVEPRDVEGLADAIRRVLNDANFREKISKAGQETAQQRFALDRMVEELETVYQEVLQG